MTFGSSIGVLPWIGSDPDRQLISRARAGDRRAFDSLLRGHADALRGFVALRVGPAAADDVLQEVWTACWLSIGQFGGRSRFKAWLYGIAANKCADHHRANVRTADSLHDLEEVATAEDDYARVDSRESVRAALQKLPEIQREVVELYYYAGLTLPEIAVSLKRNLNTVKYQFYRAHAQVERELKTEGTLKP